MLARSAEQNRQRGQLQAEGTDRGKHPGLLASWRMLLLLVMAGSLAGCAVLREEFGLFGTPREPVAAAPRAEELPKELPTIIAIMPFENQTGEVGAEQRVRREFYNLFSSKPYVDTEPALVDETIQLLERSTGRNTLELFPAEVCRALGCDGLIFGRLTSYEKVYTGVYSQLGAAAEVWMVDARTGKGVVYVSDSVSYYEGDIPLTPLGAIMTALATAANVRELQEARLVNELVYKLLKHFPEPDGVPAVRGPEIRAMIANARESPFGPGEIIKVGLFGEPGNLAGFNIGNFKTGLLMKESMAGVYLGEYAVLPGENTRDMPIIAFLRRPTGPESQWNYADGLVAIDTTAPRQVLNLRANRVAGGVELTWDYPQDMSDLAGYLVLRSQQPLSGYQELARVEHTGYRDRWLLPDGVYYYRIVAVDAAGNRADFAATGPLTGGGGEGEPDRLLQ